MSKSLVLDFDNKINDNKYSVSDLLRHCLIIAKKLKQEEAIQWINRELEGYDAEEKLPNYRLIPMSVKFYNPVYGWCPLTIINKTILETLNRMAIRQKIAEIESLTTESKMVLFSSPYEAKKMFLSEIPFDSDIAYEANAIALAGIIDSVKNRMLEWILLLEENSIVDVENVFSGEQIEKAEKLSIQVVNNFYGDNNKINVEQKMIKKRIN